MGYSPNNMVIDSCACDICDDNTHVQALIENLFADGVKLGRLLMDIMDCKENEHGSDQHDTSCKLQ